MKEKKTVHILDSLVEMTQYRDRELIAISMVKTLYQLLSAEKVELYAVHKDSEPVVLKLLARIDEHGISTRVDLPGKKFADKPSQAIIKCIAQCEQVTLNLTVGDKEVIFPILDEKGAVVGLLININSKNSPEQQQLTQGILKLYQNYLSLLEDSQRDALTGLLNRETFVNSLNKIIEKPDTKKQPNPKSTRRKYNEKEYAHWLCLIDIDHFKRINDQYGHLYGDEVLILVVSIMRKSFREEDLLFRYGGEEFIAVIKAPSKEDADIAFQRFRKAVETYQFSQVGQVTVSQGYVKITTGDFPLTIVNKADKALYYAKEHGRNCLFDYDFLIAAGELESDDEEDSEEGFVAF